VKTFIAGEIASAADVNANFNELATAIKTITTPTTAVLAAEAGWAFDTSSGTVITAGAVHTIPLTIKRTAGAFTTQVGGTFNLASVPANVQVPDKDWTVVGSISCDGYQHPLVYRTATRSIQVVPTAAASWSGAWCYGLATWIA